MSATADSVVALNAIADATPEAAAENHRLIRGGRLAVGQFSGGSNRVLSRRPLLPQATGEHEPVTPRCPRGARDTGPRWTEAAIIMWRNEPVQARPRKDASRDAGHYRGPFSSAGHPDSPGSGASPPSATFSASATGRPTPRGAPWWAKIRGRCGLRAPASSACRALTSRFVAG
jgi:hypothetical protein